MTYVHDMKEWVHSCKSMWLIVECRLVVSERDEEKEFKEGCHMQDTN